MSLDAALLLITRFVSLCAETVFFPDNYYFYCYYHFIIILKVFYPLGTDVLVAGSKVAET